jgi:hypothetical protein
MKSPKMFLSALAVVAGAVGQINAQNVLASKTVTINDHNVVKTNAPGGWNETYGSGATDLMIVNAPVAAGSKLQICFTARAVTESGQYEAIYFGLAMHASDGRLLESMSLPGVGSATQGGTTSFGGGTCYLWLPPTSDTVSFHLLTWNNYQPSLAWFATRQIYVVQLR